jgi:ABC-type lipoprotein release transport system permease subunit
MGITKKEGLRIYLYEAFAVIFTAIILGVIIGFIIAVMVTA